MLSLNNYENSSIYAFSNYEMSLPIKYCFAEVSKTLKPKSLMWLLFCTVFLGSEGSDYGRVKETQDMAG